MRSVLCPSPPVSLPRGALAALVAPSAGGTLREGRGRLARMRARAGTDRMLRTSSPIACRLGMRRMFALPCARVLVVCLRSRVCVCGPDLPVSAARAHARKLPTRIRVFTHTYIQRHSGGIMSAARAERGELFFVVFICIGESAKLSCLWASAQAEPLWPGLF